MGVALLTSYKLTPVQLQTVMSTHLKVIFHPMTWPKISWTGLTKTKTGQRKISDKFNTICVIYGSACMTATYPALTITVLK